jgi:hypothetical protein
MTPSEPVHAAFLIPEAHKVPNYSVFTVLIKHIRKVHYRAQKSPLLDQVKYLE